jgi:hypothetical protein
LEGLRFNFENNSSIIPKKITYLIHDINLIASGGNDLSSVSFDGDRRLYATSKNDGRRKKLEDFMKYQQLVVLHLV